MKSDARRAFVATLFCALLLAPPNVQAQSLTISTGPDLGTWSVGLVDGATLTATGGTGSYTWSLVSGTLPPGVSLRTDLPNFAVGSQASAALVGLATTPGLWPFRLRVTDSIGQAVEKDFTFRVVSLLTKDNFTLRDAFESVPYSYTLTALRAGAPVAATWAVTGGMPPGMNLDPATGVLSGTPTTAGVYNINVTVSEGGETVGRQFRLNVFAVRITTPGDLPNATQNQFYSTPIQAAGGTAPYTFTARNLPTGLSIDSSGLLSGTSTSRTVFNFTVTATDSGGRSYPKNMSLAVVGTQPALPAINFGGFDDCSFNNPCSRSLSVFNGGSGPFTWSASGLPAGMSIRTGQSGQSSRNPSEGEVWGAPSLLGTYNVTVTVTDSTGLTATNTFPLKVSELLMSNNVTATWTMGVLSTQHLRVLGGPSLPAIGGNAPSGIGAGSTLYTVAPLAGQAPAGVDLSTSPPMFSGTPTENIGTTARFTVTSATGLQLDASTFFNVGGGVIQISTGGNLGTQTRGNNYSNQLNACCAQAGITWDIIGGAPPSGITLSPSGVLAGTIPDSFGTFTFLVQATDSANAANFGRRQFTMSVVGLSFSSSTTLPSGNVDVPYSTTLTTSAFGGAWSVMPFNYLPPGLTLASFVTHATLSGTPQASGQFQFQLRRNDGANPPLIGTFRVSIYPEGVSPPIEFTFSNQVFPLGSRSFQLSGAIGGSGTGYQYSYTPGAQPVPGFRVQNGGQLPTFFSVGATAGLLGVPTTPGVYPTSIRVTDSVGNFTDVPFTVTVSPLHILSQSTLPKGAVNVPYSFALEPTGGTSYSWSATGLPPGLSIESNTGVISGTPQVVNTAVNNVTVTLKDLATPLAPSIAVSFTLNVDPFAITTPGALPLATSGQAYSVTFNAPGCTGTCTWPSSISGLPSGLSWNQATRTISGTPGNTTSASDLAFTLTVTSTGGTTEGSASKNFWLRHVPATAPALQVSGPGPTGNFTIGNSVSSSLNATGGQFPYTWTLDSGSLPPGLSIAGLGDALSASLTPGFIYIAGRPLALGTFTFTLRVFDFNGASATRTFVWTITRLRVEVNSFPLTSGQQIPNGTPFTGQMLVMGGTATAGFGDYTWTNTGALPYNLALNTTNGVVSGTPIESGSLITAMQVIDTGNGARHLFNLNLSIAGATVVNWGVGPSLGFTAQGTAYSQTLTINGGTQGPSTGPPYIVTAVTPLPPGLSLLTGNTLYAGTAANTIVLAGTPLQSGVFTFTLQARDFAAPTPNVRLRTFLLTVAPFNLPITTVLPDASVGEPYSHTLLTTGAPATWSVSLGSAMPPGLNLVNGVITGTPTLANLNYSFNLEAADVAGIVRQFTATLAVGGIRILNPQILPTLGTTNTLFSHQFTASGNAAWTVTAGSVLPAGFTLSSTGLLSGTPANTGVFTVNITATPTIGVRVARRFSFYVKAPNATILDVAIANTALSDVTVGQSTIFSLPVTGGRPPYAWSVASGSTLPLGFSLVAAASQGTPHSTTFNPGQTSLIGAATTPGSYSFDLIVTDSLGTSARRTFTLRVSPLAILFSNTSPGNASIRNGVSGQAYAQQLVAAGGTPSYTFSMSPVSLQQDMLPPGLSLSPAGLISGTTASTGNYAFFLRVEDAGGNVFTRRTTLAVTNNGSPVNSANPQFLITNTNPVDSTMGSGRRQFTLAVGTVGGAIVPSVTWSVTPGFSLPPGLQIVVGSPDNPFLQAGTALTGQPTAPGVFTFSLRATANGTSTFADHEFTIRVAPMQVIEPPTDGGLGATLPAGQAGLSYSTRIRMAGGKPPYTFAIPPLVPLPQGLSLSSDGVLSGTPLSIGSTNVTALVTDADGYVVQTIGLALVITPPGVPNPLITLAGLPISGNVGAPHSTNLDVLVRGGTLPYTWSLAGGQLPDGLALLAGSNGVATHLAGIPEPEAEGFHDFTLLVTDATGQSVTRAFNVFIQDFTFTPDTLPPAKVGVPYSVPFTFSGGVAPYGLFRSGAFSLAPGLTLTESGLQGTPTHAGTFPMFIGVEEADDGGGFERFVRFTVDNAAGEAPAVSLSPTPIQLFYTIGSPNPTATQVQVHASSGSFPFSLSLAGVPGVSLSQVTGTAPGTVNINWNISGLAAGSYFGVLGVKADQAVNRVDYVPVTLTVAAPPPCSYSLSAASKTVIAAGGTGTVGLTTGGTCGWTATPSDSWITLTSAPSGTGTATVRFSASANPGPQRTGTIDVAGQILTITQFGSGCSFSISPAVVTAPAAGGAAQVIITATNSSCAWTASSTSLAIAPASGAGSTIVTVTVPPNSSAPLGQSLFATIAGQSFRADQAGFACGISLSPYEASSPAAGGSGSVVVTPTAGCSYNTAVGASWINVTSGGSGSGQTTLVYEVQPNSTTLPRSTTLTIGGETFRVNQDALACSVTIDTSALGSPYGFSPGNVGSIGIVANGPNCSWVANSGAAWATITPTSGNGDQTLQVSVLSNSSSDISRSTDLTVAGQMVPITQSGLACSYSLQSSTGSVPAQGGQGVVGVVAPGFCSWSSVSNDPDWLTIQASGSGGNANVVFVALPNPTAAIRTGTLTIATQTFTVTQAAAACSFTLAAPSASFDVTGTPSASFGFNTTFTGCAAPSAVSYANWVHVLNSSFAGQDGTVAFSVDANPTAFSRQATIQIGDKTFTVNETGGSCSVSLASYGSTFTKVGGSGAVQGAAAGTCTTPPGVTQSFITINSLTGGASFTLSFSVGNYSTLNPSVRTGQITFGGQSHTVKQTSW